VKHFALEVQALLKGFGDCDRAMFATSATDGNR
jgi:hypothetical protein